MRILLTLFSVSALSAPAAGGPLLPQQPRGRIRPPSELRCDRSSLTSYDGRVIAYRRRNGSTFLRIRTNSDTTEEVVIRHPATDDPSGFYLLKGELFTKSDWRLIEKRRKVLRPGMRANVWVCRDNPTVQPVVDWQPDDAGAYRRSR
ncbi:MAG: hypothetical protein LC800_22895 [Acidobacteria bacterium]|nr:hypothetical protein [Acidobacteriota bacterium]